MFARYLTIVLLLPAGLNAQSNCDCIDAIEIKNSKTQIFSSKGTGNLLEISDPDNRSLYWFEKEHNTGWFKFQVKAQTEMTLTIAPSNGNDDMDFILLKYDFDGFCDRIKLKKKLPVRSNLARSGLGKEAATGMKPEAQIEYVHSGPGDAWSKSLAAEKDEVFYLVVDNVSGSGEYTVTVELGEKKLKKNDEASPEAPEKYEEIKTPFKMIVLDDKTGEKVSANFDIAGYQIGEPYRVNAASVYTLDLSSSQNITINCNAPGYIFFTKAMMAPPIPFDAVKRPDTVKFEVRIKKIKIGEAVKLDNIKFVGDETAFLPVSRPTLLSLYKFMLENPAARIDVVGHVNAPDMRNSPKLKKLSKDRAKAVYDYLVEKGIDGSRVNYKGMGNSKLVYKKPLNEKQNEENRRVEIVVTAL